MEKGGRKHNKRAIRRILSSDPMLIHLLLLLHHIPHLCRSSLSKTAIESEGSDMTLRGALGLNGVFWTLKRGVFAFLWTGDSIDIDGQDNNKSIRLLYPTRIHMPLKESDFPTTLVVLRPRCSLCLSLYLRTYANATCARGQCDLFEGPKRQVYYALLYSCARMWSSI